MSRLFVFIVFACGTILNACTKTKTEFSESEIKYIKTLGLLEDREVPVLFDTQMDFKTSGNFISDRRIASYWVDKNDTSVNSALYAEIDSIVTRDLRHSLTRSSYLIIFTTNRPPFEVYVDGDSIEVWTFFNEATSRWQKKK